MKLIIPIQTKPSECFVNSNSKIYNGTLEIRKTEAPCHAKMYLFAYDNTNNENGEQLGDVITGTNVRTPFDITDGKFFNLKYQTDAIQLALKSIERIIKFHKRLHDLRYANYAIITCLSKSI